MIIGMIQMKTDAGKKEKNISRAFHLMEEAAPRCGLLILPELWMIGYDFRKIHEQAVCPGDALMESLSRFAAYHRVTVAAGTVPLRREGALYNTAMVFGPDGCLQCTYSKRRLFYGYLESELLRPGTGSSQTEIGGVTCGFAVCYELYFPELFSEIAARGADMAIVPMSWPAPRIERMQILARARAIENGMAVCAINMAGEYHGIRMGGHSCFVDQEGNVLAEAGEKETILYAEYNTNTEESIGKHIAALRAERNAQQR